MISLKVITEFDFDGVIAIINEFFIFYFGHFT
jgi:hypothetical protein